MRSQYLSHSNLYLPSVTKSLRSRQRYSYQLQTVIR